MTNRNFCHSLRLFKVHHSDIKFAFSCFSACETYTTVCFQNRLIKDLFKYIGIFSDVHVTQKFLASP